MRKPHFFKILLDDFDKRLRIPPYFVNNFFKVESSAGGKVIIHDANGGAWNVGLETITSGTFLTRGWSKFVKDHQLKQHEFLVFRYEGNMRFRVVLFFDTTCMDYVVLLMQVVPAPFARQYLPRRKMKIILHDPNGDADDDEEEENWDVVYNPGERSHFLGGWSAFVQDNSIQEGDYCAFELVGPDEFCVTIFRNFTRD